MEKDSGINIIDVICYTALGIIFYYGFYYYILPLFSSRGSDCGCRDGATSVSAPNIDLTAKEKACLAVEVCRPSDVSRDFDSEEKHKWKHAIIMNAEKIFGAVKTAKATKATQKQSGKRKKK